jgi:hypothetical protein
MADLHIDWPERIAGAQARCREILSQPDFAAIPGIAAGLGVTPAQLGGLVARTARTGLPQEAWEPLAEACERQGIPGSGHVLERFVLLNAGLANLPHAPGLPVAEEVKERLLEQVLYVCAPDRDIASLLDARQHGFQVMCRFMLLTRFPTGQSDWEVSAFPRSWLAKFPLRDIPRALACVFLRAGGHRPFFETHTAIRRDSPMMAEEFERETFRLMAISMRLQPAIRGHMAASWLMSPNLAEGSPHLAWQAAWWQECKDFGAVWTNLGPAPADAGFLVGDPRRRRLYEAGKWKPLRGVLIWARRDLLGWYDSQYGR